MAQNWGLASGERKDKVVRVDKPLRIGKISGANLGRIAEVHFMILKLIWDSSKVIKV